MCTFALCWFEKQNFIWVIGIIRNPAQWSLRFGQTSVPLRWWAMSTPWPGLRHQQGLPGWWRWRPRLRYEMPNIFNSTPSVWHRLNDFLHFIQIKFWKDRGAISNGAGADGWTWWVTPPTFYFEKKNWKTKSNNEYLKKKKKNCLIKYEVWPVVLFTRSVKRRIIPTFRHLIHRVFFLPFLYWGYAHLLLKIASRRSGLEATQWVDTDPANWAGSRQYLQEQHGHVRLCWHVGNETAGKCGRPSKHSIPAPAKVPQQSGVTLLQFVSGSTEPS